MLDGDMYLDNVDIDDLAMSASDLLDQYRKRGMPYTIHRMVLEKSYATNNLEKLKGLVAKFEAAIQDHDAEVAAAHTALVDHACMHGDHDTHETFQVASSSAHASSCSTSSGATKGIQGNAEGSCTITISPTHQENLCTTVLAAARHTACQAVNRRSGRPHSEEVCSMPREEIRLFAFDTGRQYLIDWCMGWMKTDRAAGRIPTLGRMKEEWTRQKTNGVPFFVEQKGVKYGIDNINLRWQMLLDYEKQGAAEGGDSTDAHNDDGDLSASPRPATPTAAAAADAG
jgi:hypothetical protein